MISTYLKFSFSMGYCNEYITKFSGGRWATKEGINLIKYIVHVYNKRKREREGDYVFQ